MFYGRCRRRSRFAERQIGHLELIEDVVAPGIVGSNTMLPVWERESGLLPARQRYSKLSSRSASRRRSSVMRSVSQASSDPIQVLTTGS